MVPAGREGDEEKTSKLRRTESRGKDRINVYSYIAI
jgi:hypothetical protein